MSLVKRKNSIWFPSVFDELMKPDWFGGTFNEVRANIPAVNIKEDDASFSLELAAPGISKEDFKIDLDNDVLTISSEKKSENEEANKGYTRKEFSYHSFKRSFTIPESVDPNAIGASYENGVLTVALPKKEEAVVKPNREIKIS